MALSRNYTVSVKFSDYVYFVRYYDLFILLGVYEHKIE